MASTTPCSGCGKLCQQRKTSPRAPLCLDCRRKRSIGICEICGKQYVRRPDARTGNTRPIQKYCGKDCAIKAVSKGRWIACSRCLTPIWRRPYYLVKHKTHFCPDCADQLKLGPQNPRRERPEGSCYKRRAEYYGVSYERITSRLVYERDKWICGICHKQVDSTLKFPDKMRASLDHITPMSRGGPHLYSNVQCSHLACNVAKGNREQKVQPNAISGTIYIQKRQNQKKPRRVPCPACGTSWRKACKHPFHYLQLPIVWGGPKKCR